MMDTVPVPYLNNVDEITELVQYGTVPVLYTDAHPPPKKFCTVQLYRTVQYDTVVSFRLNNAI